LTRSDRQLTVVGKIAYFQISDLSTQTGKIC